MSEKLEILATPMDDPNFCRFTLGVSPMVENEIVFDQRPGQEFFIQDLFDVEGISQIILDTNYIICQKSVDTPWQVLGKTIGNILRLNYKRNLLKVPKEVIGQTKMTSKAESEIFVKINDEFIKSDLAKGIQEIIELQIQPSLGAHGGSVRILDFQAGKLFVNFSGGCQGCSQASVTVKDGIEKIITSKFSEVKEVVDVTNHSSGENPYFK